MPKEALRDGVPRYLFKFQALHQPTLLAGLPRKIIIGTRSVEESDFGKIDYDIILTMSNLSPLF